jgi:serine protease Do
VKSLFRFAVFLILAAALIGGLWLARGMRERGATRDTGPLIEVMDREFTDLVASVLPSVVSIDAIPGGAVDPGARALSLMLGIRPGEVLPQLGSGVIVSADGYLLTNHHVVEGAGAVRVHLNDGRILPARYLGGDHMSDLAVLRIDASDLSPFRWGNSDDVRIGQRVIAVGNPLGLQETVTQGIISGKGRRASSEAANEFFQTDAAINQGNSGGPLLNLRGELIGINNLVTASGEGIAFAIPSNTARRVFESIRDHGRFVRPWFGALMRPLTPMIARQLGMDSVRGALLLGAYENSPAALAGLLPGDVVISFNGRPIVDHIDLRNRVAEAEIGGEVSLVVLRAGREIPLTARIAAEPGPGQ